MHIYYRISDAGYKKEKPAYINNENCLRNFVKQFNRYIERMVVIADNTSADTDSMILNYVPSNNLMKVSVGHGAGTFNIALDMALKLADTESVYFVENDYLHTSDAPSVLEEGLEFGFSFVTLYDHPDKYLNPSEGGNPFCEGKSEVTRVYRTNTSHWKLTNSTTMTFAAKASTLRKNEAIIRKWTSGNHPYDYQMFLEIIASGHTLSSPIPGLSTHGEVRWLTFGTNWEKLALTQISNKGELSNTRETTSIAHKTDK